MAKGLFSRRDFIAASAGVALAGGVQDPGESARTIPATLHLWEKMELTFTASRSFSNPYTDVTVWIDLSGPGFETRVYGFWDGGSVFRVRLTATAPGHWRWKSGSEPPDSGLANKRGSFDATEWSQEEKQENPLRGGFLQATPNQHALQTADGAPFFVLGDTWWTVGTNRFHWYDDDKERPMGPTAGFKDYVRYRKAQGFNWINVIAGFPNWETDGLFWRLTADDADKTLIRSAWTEFGSGSAKNVTNEGGLPFLFPGKAAGFEKVFPDVNRINPEYFQYLDRKIDYLNAQGFVPFIEVMRRDAGPAWAKYYKWPDSYSRYIQYVWSRYQANNTVLSPVHLDEVRDTIPLAMWLQAIDLVMKKYGPPPFGTLLSANSSPSTLVNWGDNSWVTLQQCGNKREHEYYWYMTEIFRNPSPKPGLNGEPYYAGFDDARNGKGYQFGAVGGTAKDDRFVRSAMYGNVLSGGLAGHVYGAEGIWGADIEPAAPVKMWNAFQWNSSNQMKFLRDFIFSIGKQYQDLVPDSGFVVPSQTHMVKGYDGWAYSSRTPDKKIFMLYFEQGCPPSLIRGACLASFYRAQWYNPENGTWLDLGDGTVRANIVGEIDLPDFPSEGDWALRLMYQGPDLAALKPQPSAK